MTDYKKDFFGQNVVARVDSCQRCRIDWDEQLSYVGCTSYHVVFTGLAPTVFLFSLIFVFPLFPFFSLLPLPLLGLQHQSGDIVHLENDSRCHSAAPSMVGPSDWARIPTG